MASFDYGFAYAFNQAGNSSNFSQNDTQVGITGTIDDGTGDGVFNLNDPITDPNFGALFPDYVGPPVDPEPTVVGSFSTGTDLWLVVLAPNSSPNATGQSGKDNLVFYGPAGADPNLLPTNNISINNDIDLNDTPECFATGTLIRSPGGERRVEDLQVGDLILNADGRLVAIKWMGRHTVTYGALGGGSVPIRIRAGALGAAVPHTDLVVTEDHGILFDGLVIIASALVNGVTIVREPSSALPRQMVFHHIELDRHDRVFANGAVAETYVDYKTRQRFDNYQDYVELYGAEKIIEEMDLPRISAARLVPSSIFAKLEGSAVA